MQCAVLSFKKKGWGEPYLISILSWGLSSKKTGSMHTSHDRGSTYAAKTEIKIQNMLSFSIRNILEKETGREPSFKSVAKLPTPMGPECYTEVSGRRYGSCAIDVWGTLCIPQIARPAMSDVHGRSWNSQNRAQKSSNLSCRTASCRNRGHLHLGSESSYSPVALPVHVEAADGELGNPHSLSATFTGTWEHEKVDIQLRLQTARLPLILSSKGPRPLKVGT